MQLTALYGACFVIAGAALLGLTYEFVSHTDATRQQAVVIHAAGNRAATNLLLSLRQLPGPIFDLPGTATAGGKTFPGEVRASGSSRGRIVSSGSGRAPAALPLVRARLSSRTRKQIDLLVASATVALKSQQTETLGALLEESGIALAIMAIVSIGLGWLLGARALRPLRVMNLRAKRITEDNLHERLGVEGRADELGELARTFDDLLARLERAFDSQRRFVANASHELRTPLTLERTLVEVALADPEASVDSLRRTCERVLVASEQQERLIEALLALARGQGGAVGREAVDLAALVEDVLAIREHDLAGISVRTSVEAAAVAGDPALLERVVANLIDNAIVHNLPGGWIEVEIGTASGAVRLRVANGGSVIAPERVDELFEPFRRLDGERSVGGGRGLGLGLSIVQAIVVAHGGGVTGRAQESGGLELEVSLPRASSRDFPACADASAAALRGDPFPVQRA